MAFLRRKAKQPAHKPVPRALLFDTFGTTVDWYAGMVAHAERIGAETLLHADWSGLVKEWRAHYKPAIKPVRESRRAWTSFDELHREELDKIVKKYRADKLTGAQRDRLTQGWHALCPWPEVPGALHRLVKHFILGPLTNGTTRQMIDLARYGNLPWSVVFGADMFRTYKPSPTVYEGAVALLDFPPGEVLMVAAHNQDLQAAQKYGLQTCFVHRSTEDKAVEGSFDYVVDNFEQLARALQAV